MSLLHRGHASLLQAAACSLLTQSCILLYDGDGSQGGSSQGGNGGQAGGAVHSSSATGTGGGGNASGGGGNGGEGGSGAFSCGAMEGAFPLVDVGQFGSLTEAAIQGIQALAPGPDGSVVAAAFSGPGFTTSDIGAKITTPTLWREWWFTTKANWSYWLQQTDRDNIENGIDQDGKSLGALRGDAGDLQFSVGIEWRSE